MAANIVIEKLSKENYDSWKIQMEAVLIKNDHWDYATGNVPKPEADATEIARWTTNDNKARADLILAIAPAVLNCVKNCNTSHEVWSKLTDNFESKGPARKASLLKSLLFTKMTDNSMTDHLNEFFAVIDKLSEMDIKIADDLQAILMLYSIPESYENFRIAIESRDELPTPENLKIKLLEEAASRRNREKFTPSKQKAFYSNSKRSDENKRFVPANPIATNRKFPRNINTSQQQDWNTTKPTRYKCNYCSKFGHKSSECRKRQYDQNKQQSSAFAADEERALKTEVGLPTSSDFIFCLDSGATSHMCYNEKMFSDLHKIADTDIKLAVDQTVKAIGRGTVEFKVQTGTGTSAIKLLDVLCVPELKNNLISVSKISSYNNSVHFLKNCAEVINSEGNLVLKAYREHNLYYVKSVTESVSIVKEIEQWHLRLGHLNENDLKKLQSNNMVSGLSFKPNDSLPDCKVCIKGKQTATPLPKSSKYRSTELLNIIHSDICGPMRVESIGKSFYFATFIDDKSRYVEVHFLKSKDEVKDAFLKFKATAENTLNRKIKILRTDNGLEYLGRDFDRHLEEKGIRRQKTNSYTPAQNGVAERENRTLVEMARCLLIQSKLPHKFWAEAIVTSVYTRNRCPTRSIPESRTPYQLYFDRQPSVKHFRIFGQKAFALDKRPNKGKFDVRSKECTFIGYSSETKGYRLWDNEKQTVITSRDIRFIDEFENLSSCDEIEFFQSEKNEEKLTPQISHSTTPEVKGEPLESPTCDVGTVPKNDENFSEERSSADLAKNEREIVQDEADDFSDCQQTHMEFKRGRGRPKKIYSGTPGRPRKQYQISADTPPEQAQICEDLNPSLDEALKSQNADEWRTAMKTEFEALVKNGAWTLVKRPTNKKIIGCRWVLRTKFKADGTAEKRKARLVAKGCAQIPGIDYDETFAPVARPSSIRTVVAYCAENDLDLFQLDFVMAYVNGDINEEIYMEQAQGFEDPSQPDHVYSLKKSLYGLKQSGRQWYIKLDESLRKFGLTPLNSDKCIYRMKTSEGELIIIVYVDDLIIATNNMNMYKNIKRNLAKEFEVKDLGKLHYCLGIEFHQDKNCHSITMSQKKYIDNILTKFNMQDAKTVTTPLDYSLKLTKDMGPSTESEKREMAEFPYRSLIGSLMYLAVCTRPDIAFTISHLSQFNNNPGKQHWMAAKRVLRYLKGTRNKGLKFQRTGKPLLGFTDADWASDLNDRKSYTGYVFKLADGPITWDSHKQSTVALSSTEAEYMSLTEAAKETVYLRKFLKELNPHNELNTTTIYCDNQGAQKIMKNSVYHSRTKHIDLRHHYIREIYEKGIIDVKYLPTENMPADVLTKTLQTTKHLKCCNFINIISV